MRRATATATATAATVHRPPPLPPRAQLKERAGSIERLAPDGGSAVCRGLFKKETDMGLFEGLRVTTGAGEVGVIAGRFGLSGKFKVEFPPPGLAQAARSGRSAADNALLLRYKRYVYDQRDKHSIRQ